MTMTSDIAVAIDQIHEAGAARLQETPAWLSAYLACPQVDAGIEKLERLSHTVSMTSALYEDQRVVPIEVLPNGWTSMLLSINREASSASTPGGGAIIHVIEAAAPLRFHWFRIEGLESLRDVPGGARLADRETVTLVRGDTVVIPQDGRAILLEGSSAGVRLLRFNGPPSAPISLAFDPVSGAMISSSYSDSEATARHFFSILVGELSRQSGAESPLHLSSEERAEIGEMLDTLCSEDLHAFTRWRMVQAMARTKPASAISQLRAMAQEGLPNLGRHASMALTRIGNPIP